MARKISVVIPVYNDPEGLDATLRSLMAQDFPRQDFEIIVADNDSSERTAEVINLYEENHPNLVRSVVEDHVRSSYAARNKGVEAAEGEIISFIDADMTVRPDWLNRVRAAVRDVDPDYMGCKVHMYSTSKSVSSLYNILTGFPVKSYMKRAHYAPTCCLTVKRDVFDRIGFFDGRLESGGDTEFGNRAWDAGLKFHYAGQIVMHHSARGTVTALLKKAYRIGRGGRGQLSSLHPERYGHFARSYLSIRRYLPRRPWAVRGNYRCGYSFTTWTVIQFSLFPPLLNWVSLFGFLQAKVSFWTRGGGRARGASE
jgi:glycosyltransferase involved in cell wall biosynthesis